MKWKKLLLVSTTLFFVGSVTALAADDAYEWLKAKKIEISVNDQTVPKSGWMIHSGDEGTAYMPARELADHLQAIIDWDPETNTTNFYKPNVHMAFNFKRKDGSLGTFGKVSRDSELNFFIFTQIDSLHVKVHSLKYEIEAPNGEIVYSYEEPLEDQDESLMWNYSPNIRLTFDQVGEYTAKIYMNIEEDGEYFLVSKKILYSADIEE